MRLAKIVIFIIFSFPFTQSAISQNQPGKFDLRLGLSTYPTNYTSSFSKDRKYNRHYEAQASYRFTPYLSSGLYMGYMFRDVTTTTFEYMCYGVNSRVHILPLIFSGKNARLDLYAKGQLGVAEILLYDFYKPRFDYLLNAGASFYPLRNLGVFVEGGLKRPYNLFSKGINLQYGLSIRF